MELTDDPLTFRRLLADQRGAGRRVGLVPTMGALHAGHESLFRASAAAGDYVAATIFVNPLQFGDPEDLDKYPRDPDGDARIAAAAGVDLLFAPAEASLFPDGRPATSVRVATISTILEGASRPGHFDGVATIVTKLLSLAGSCVAYFGEKDFQQLAVVRRLVADLSLAAAIVGCPIVREPDGLAMSSRNRRLSPSEREAAVALSRALEAGRAVVAKTVTRLDAPAAERAMAAILAEWPLVEPDYAVAVDPVTLSEPDEGSTNVRLLVAARVGPVRLIDNCAAQSSL